MHKNPTNKKTRSFAYICYQYPLYRQVHFFNLWDLGLNFLKVKIGYFLGWTFLSQNRLKIFLGSILSIPDMFTTLV